MPEAFPFEITEYGPSGPQQVHIEAIREVPLTIYLNDREVVTLLCTPRDLGAQGHSSADTGPGQ